MENKMWLIDPSVIIRDLTAMKSQYDAIALDGIIKALKEAPTVDARPVVHGRWIGQRCSLCNGSYMDYADADSYPAVGEPKPNYCPNCGSQMDGGDCDGK